MALPSQSKLAWTIHGIELIQKSREFFATLETDEAKKLVEEMDVWLSS